MFIHESITVNKTNVVANDFIPKGTIIITSPNDYEADCFSPHPALDIIYQMLKDKEDKLFPRDGDKYTLHLDYVKILNKELTLVHWKYLKFFNTIPCEKIKQYYAKYIFNAFNSFNGNIKNGNIKNGNLESEKNMRPVINIIGARLNHNCHNNVDFVFSKNEQVFTTNRDVDRGEEICDNYLLNKKIPNKGEYLLKHYNFVCTC
jgi:hypothetical protein